MASFFPCRIQAGVMQKGKLLALDLSCTTLHVWAICQTRLFSLEDTETLIVMVQIMTIFFDNLLQKHFKAKVAPRSVQSELQFYFNEAFLGSAFPILFGFQLTLINTICVPDLVCVSQLCFNSRISHSSPLRQTLLLFLLFFKRENFRSMLTHLSSKDPMKQALSLPILQRRERRHREVNHPAQDYMASKWQIWKLKAAF